MHKMVEENPPRTGFPLFLNFSPRLVAWATRVPAQSRSLALRGISGTGAVSDGSLVPSMGVLSS